MTQSAAGGAARGLLAGIQAGQQLRKNRRLEKMYDAEYKSMLDDDLADYEAYLATGGNPDNWDKIEPGKDPLIMRIGQGLKNFVTGKKAEPEVDSYDRAFNDFAARRGGVSSPMPQEKQPMSALDAFGYNRMADGGDVDEDEYDRRMERAYGDRAYQTEAEAKEFLRQNAGRYTARNDRRASRGVIRDADTSGGGVGALMQDVARTEDDYSDRQARALDLLEKGGIRNTVAGATEYGNAVLESRIDPVLESMGNAGRSALGGVGAAAKGVYDAAAGFFAGAEDEPVATESPTNPGAATEADTVDPSTKSALQATGGGKSDEQITQTAVDTGVKATPGHPDNPEQEFNWAEIRASGVRPDDIPNMLVDDWVQYRKDYVLSQIRKGKSPAEADAEVTKMQMGGMLRNMQQAQYLLMGGDAQSAALAMRAAYQYMPNGSDVRFGITKDANGRDVLIGMGRDEKTGEEVGAPMLLSPETVGVMVEQFSNPAAFRSWTKDWRDEDFQREVFNWRQQTDQANIDLRARGLELEGERNQQSAMRGGAGTGAARIDAADRNRAYQAINEARFNLPEGVDQTQFVGLAQQTYDKLAQFGIGEGQIISAVEQYMLGDDTELRRLQAEVIARLEQGR